MMPPVVGVAPRSWLPGRSVREGLVMFPYRVVAWSVLASVLIWTGQASAGWIIEQMEKGGGEGSRQQVMLQANRMKTTMYDGGKPIGASILDLNSQTITQVDYPERHYVTATVQEYAQTMQMALSQAAEAMKQMPELKNIPPEQRKMVEAMMRSQTSQAGSSECREPRIEVRKTAQQATIAGYPAVRFDVLADGKPGSEVWIAKGITAWRELDAQKLDRFAAEMTKLAGCPGQGRQGLPGTDPSWKLANEGYPVRTVDRGGRGGTVEVVKAESRTVQASEFQPPPGFARKTLQEMMGNR